MHGLHLTADLTGCASSNMAMTEPDALRSACLAAVQDCGLHAVGSLFHRFPPLPGQTAAPGITGVVLLAESHLALHTWPELGVVTLDVYVCNMVGDNSVAAETLLVRLSQLFAPASVQRGRLLRGHWPGQDGRDPDLT
jgi:S-adenosylmethionine decarboxylase proenzyme